MIQTDFTFYRIMSEISIHINKIELTLFYINFRVHSKKNVANKNYSKIIIQSRDRKRNTRKKTEENFTRL